jgi:prepilin-type N-terminal cleavage/methylation domain-containing protein
MKRNRTNEQGFSLIELLIVIAIILIIAAIAIPNLLHARVSANESSAVGSLHAISAAEVSYANMYPIIGFAPTIANLGGTNCDTPDQTAACLIDSSLASGSKSTYNFTSTGLGTAPYGQYFATATPASGTSRSYCLTEDGVIHYDDSGAAIADHDSCLALTQLQ